MDDGNEGRTPTVTALRAALSKGDPTTVAALVGSGADIHYKTEHDYDALMDAVHGRDVARDPRLLDLLTLLVNYGVNLSGETTYRESGLRALSRVGRFDAVRLLLIAGADVTQLEWTRLHLAVALLPVAEVRAELDAGENPEERDWWGRTAWLLALLTGGLDKAKLLRDRGADTAAVGGFTNQPPAFFAIHGRNPAVLRWLIEIGVDVHRTDDSGDTALRTAVYADDLEAVDVLLAAGADVDAGNKPFGTAVGSARTPAMITRLLAAGADPGELGCGGQRILIRAPVAALDAPDVTPADYRRAHTRRFGRANPERMHEPFWEAMVRCGATAYAARTRFADTGPPDGPVWCADRFGQSLTLLPDGRAVQIGGEHEDWYDPDFCIYNDVFVHEPGGGLAVYAYPEDVFPPTDFHTATLVGGTIYVIGSLGYAGTRRPGVTPVYRLDLATMRMERVGTDGERPGWVHGHRAASDRANRIRVWGGKVILAGDRGEDTVPNVGTFVLDLEHRVWHREVAGG